MLIIVIFCAGYFIALCFEDAVKGDLFSLVAIFIFLVVFVITMIRVIKQYVFFLTEVRKETNLKPLTTL
jgi:hypothetical protein